MSAPICCVCSAPSALQCAACHTARYCSPVCQRKDWKTGHKASCKAAAAAPASAKGKPSTPSATPTAGTAAAAGQPNVVQRGAPMQETKEADKPSEWRPIERPADIWAAARKGVLAEIGAYTGAPGAVDAEGKTPLAHAVWANQPKWVSAWVAAHGTGVLAAPCDGDRPALLVAAEVGTTSMVRTLVACGADVGVTRASDGSTALHAAARSDLGAAAKVDFLLHGCKDGYPASAHPLDVDARDASGATALDVARSRGLTEAARLIEAEVARQDPDLADYVFIPGEASPGSEAVPVEV